MKAVGLTIPDGVHFADLQLARDADGNVSFDVEPIRRIVAASNLDTSAFRGMLEDNLASLVATWYRAHIAAGGAPDPIAEELVREAGT